MLETWDWNQVSNSLAACFFSRRAFFGRHIKTIWFDSTATWLMVVGIEKMLNIQTTKPPVSTHSTWWTWPKAYIAENETSEHLAEHEAYLKFSMFVRFSEKPDFGGAPPGGPVMTLTRSFEQRYPQFFPTSESAPKMHFKWSPSHDDVSHGPYQFRWLPDDVDIPTIG